MYSCSNLAVWADGRTVQTVEGLARGGQLDPLQHAFIEHDAPQCGFCTSGQLMSAKALLNFESASDARRSAGRDDRQHLPLLELQPLRRGGAGRGSGAGAARKSTVLDSAGTRTRGCRHERDHEAAQDSRPSDAAHRRARARYRTGPLHRRRATARHALRAGAAQPACARAHPQHRRFESAGAAGREGGHHARKLPGRLGRRFGRGRHSIQRRHQEEHQAAAVCRSTTRCGSSAIRWRRWRRRIGTSPKKRCS